LSRSASPLVAAGESAQRVARQASAWRCPEAAAVFVLTACARDLALRKGVYTVLRADDKQLPFKLSKGGDSVRRAT
jgi:hypothetical protein